MGCPANEADAHLLIAADPPFTFESSRTDSFDVLQPGFVDAVQNCQGARFVQAGRAVG